jgi:hypothetical protein
MTEKAGLHLYTKYHEAVMLRMAINVEHLTEWVNQKMIHTPEI